MKRANNQNGVAEIWKATAATDLTGITVTSTPTGLTPSQSLVVLTFAGSGGVGASAAASGPLGGPSVSLTATKTGSFSAAEFVGGFGAGKHERLSAADSVYGRLSFEDDKLTRP